MPSVREYHDAETTASVATSTRVPRVLLASIFVLYRRFHFHEHRHILSKIASRIAVIASILADSNILAISLDIARYEKFLGIRMNSPNGDMLFLFIFQGWRL